ncbi:MAG TPA: hypothetical protein VHC72_10515 [Bryobacteraceae bacterium]|nr:hypothetical protein [Bryobacteraceae bacterium]
MRDKVVPVDTPEGRDAINQQLERVLSSPVFKSSKRYPALLRYIVEQTLEGRESTIKERILGVEVFGRSADYDTNADHVVRTAAGEVRKRLAQYYMEPGRENELRIDVPAGSYIPQFRPAPEPVPTWPPERANPPAPAVTGWRKHVKLLLIMSAVLNVVFLLFFAEENKVDVVIRGESTLQKFWAPVMQSGGPVLMCVGTRDFVFTPGQARGALQGGGQTPAQLPGGTAQNPGISTSQDPLMRRVSMADVLTLARISAYVGSQRVPYHILNPASTTFTDLRNGPAILIGAGNNNWARQLTDNLRFSFTTANPDAPDNVRPIGIRDRQHPENHNWVTYTGPEPPVYKEYGLISRLQDPRVEQVIVVIGGLGAHATEAAGEFVTDPLQLKKLEAFTPAGWARKNIQIVLSVEVVRGKSGPPKVEAAWFW